MAKTTKPKLYRVGRARTGLGLFAAADIPSGKLLIEYTGIRIPTREAREIDKRRANKYLFEIDNRFTIDGSPRSNLARYVNHSCDPNTEAESNRGRMMFRTVRKIAEGEEITLDYGEEHMELYFGPAGCLCDACKAEKSKAAKSKLKKARGKRASARRVDR
ncbi:MAG TPA: SET domain-containing protein [Pseudolabrys sp.]|nr:SET domain-containing protein [Pseudolabrys sp.]